MLALSPLSSSPPFNDMKWCFATAPLPHAEHRPVLGEVARLILLPLTQRVPPRWPAHNQRHQPRLLPTSAAPGRVHGGSAPGKGGASSERQCLNNSQELSKRNRSCCPLGRRGAVGRARSCSLSSPSSPVSLCHATSRTRLHQPREQAAGGTAQAPRVQVPGRTPGPNTTTPLC